MFSLLHHRQFRTHLATLAVLSVLGLGAIKSYELIHDIFEPDCPGKTSGNPADCLFCASLLLLVAESAPEIILPEPVGAGDFVKLPETTPLTVRRPVLQSGRSPPLSS